MTRRNLFRQCKDSSKARQHQLEHHLAQGLKHATLKHSKTHRGPAHDKRASLPGSVVVVVVVSGVVVGGAVVAVVAVVAASAVAVAVAVVVAVDASLQKECSCQQTLSMKLCRSPRTLTVVSTRKLEKLALNSGTTGGARKMTQNASKKPFTATMDNS